MGYRYLDLIQMGLYLYHCEISQIHESEEYWTVDFYYSLPEDSLNKHRCLGYILPKHRMKCFDNSIFINMSADISVIIYN